jgi:hypothetical protein
VFQDINAKQLIFQCILDEKHHLASYGVKNIGRFGSFVRGEQTPLSDIDLLVEFLPDMHAFDNFMEVAFLLERVLDRKIELVTREALSPYIGPYILREVERVPITA